MTDLTHTASAHALRPLLRIVAAIVTPATKVVAFYRNRRTMTELAELDNHMLADIGLSRSDLRDATGVGAGRDPVMLLSLRRNERRAPRHMLREVDSPSIANEALGASRPARPSVQPC